MRIAIVGSGAVGGYYGARLVQAGHQVAFIARGAHLAAMRDHGLTVRSPALGDFSVPVEAHEDPARVGPVDVVVVAVKAYDNPTALPLAAPMVGPDTAILTLQNGVDSSRDLAGLYGERAVLCRRSTRDVCHRHRTVRVSL
jgi:2-dehydropantoate 2-reductase